MDVSERRRLLRSAGFFAALFVALVGIGTALFTVTSDESLEEAFYRSIGAFTTTDLYPEPTRSSERALSAALTILGGLFYLLLVGSVVRTLLISTIRETYRERRMKKLLANLSDHYIVCGYGNIGRAVAEALQGDGKDVVVIDRKSDNAAAAEKEGVLSVVGDAHDSDLLIEVGVRRAAGLVGSVGSDAENIYIALAARRCNPTIYVVARASTREAARNMQSAQVFDRVSTPYAGAGRALATQVIEQRKERVVEEG